jgi:hypothetical protein
MRSDEALLIEIPICLEHGVGIDGQGSDDVSYSRELVAPSQITEPDRVLHLLDELKIGRHARARVQPKDDGGTGGVGAGLLGQVVIFIYHHR